jgi:aminoglycoside phosphotransferase (APT) family kinase protein
MTQADSAAAADREELAVGRLSGWMAENIPGFAGPLSYAKFPGGQSNPTYRIDTPSGSYVLRRKPMGQLLPSAHQVDREHRVMRALQPMGFPVPRQLGLCLDRNVIGSEFYVMELIGGRTIWDGTMPDMTPAQRRQHYRSMIDTLADLHIVDPDAAGLGDFGRPGNYFDRQIARWTKQYRAAQTEHLPAMEALIDFLPRAVPQEGGRSIVHGDYRIDNLKFAAEDDPQVLAVLDWELSTVGDPIADLTYFLMGWVTTPDGRFGVEGQTGERTGIPTLDEIVARYCARTGRSGISQLDWYFAFNFFRLAGIVQGVRKRFLIGTASDVKADKAGARMPLLVDTAWHFAERAAASRRAN